MPRLRREALQGLIERGQRIRFEALRECLVDPVVEPWEAGVQRIITGCWRCLKGRGENGQSGLEKSMKNRISLSGARTGRGYTKERLGGLGIKWRF